MMPSSSVSAHGARMAILFYVNRSGSTLVSRLLSEYSDQIYVVPEVVFPTWLMLQNDRGRPVSGDALFHVIRSDYRFDALGIGEEQLRAICASCSSQDIAGLLTRLGEAKLGRTPRVVLFKLTNLIHLTEALHREFENPVYLHIVRDPRAVANSMLRTPIPEKPGFNMARESVGYAARHWRDYMRRIGQLGESFSIHEIRYEDLREREEDLMATILEQLSLTPLKRDRQLAENYAVSEIDGDLHSNVFDDFKPGRVSAWTHELSNEAIRVIESICWDEMLFRGYAPSFERAGHFTRLMIGDAVRSAALDMRHVVKTLAAYAAREGGLSDLARRLQLAALARRG